MLCLLSAAACGLIGDSLDEKNKELFVDIPDAAFLKACLAAGDLNGDGRISVYEAQRVLTISCPDAEIGSVEGIQAFIYLQNFNCPKNKIVSMDLRQNTRLQQIDCSNNQLTYLSINGLYALKQLLCGNNQLTSLDLGSNQALSTLNCNSNRLTVLDVSQCARNMLLLSALNNPRLSVIYVSALQTFGRQSIDGQTQIVPR